MREFRRTSYCASLITDNGGKLTLYDAVLRYAKEDEMTFSGLELDELGTKFTAMSWRVKLVPTE
ncbi:hypothetical protein [Massilia sp. TN1-12]|uniref:hypothetical protein n=1 Tax=Massilia paldalensis TaxID=3377675 RepID=UPI00384B48FF